MANLTFDLGLAVAAFISVFACFHSRQQVHLAMEGRDPGDPGRDQQ